MRTWPARLLGLLLLIVAGWTAPLAGSFVAAHADPAKPQETADGGARAAATTPTTVCVAKKGGAVRVPAGTSCKSRERKVTVTVAKRTTWCLAKKGAVTDAVSSKAAKACKRARGKKVVVPSNSTLTLCARTDRAARWVKGAAKCRGAEKRRVFVNAAPTGLSAAGLLVVDGAPVGTVAATLAARDVNVGDKLSYRLVAGAGGVDNAAFTISGNRLVLARVPDHAVKPTLGIRVQVRDRLGRSATRTFTVQVQRLADIVLTPNRIQENEPAGTVIGQLSLPNAEAGEAFTFTVVSGPVAVVGDELSSTRAYDFEAEQVVSVVIRASNGVDAPIEVPVAISVDDVNEAPIVSPDSYSGAIGNTVARVGLPDAAGAVTLSGAVPLANDTDPEGAPLSVVADENLATTRGGHVSIAANGTFEYRPGTGQRGGTDTFTIQVTDGTHQVANPVSIALRDVAVWYVDSAAASGGTGAAWSPFANLASVTGALDADAPGDVVRLAPGTHTAPAAGFALEANQRLLGGAAALTVDGVTLLPAAGASTVSGSATAALVQLAEGAEVAGLTLAPSGTTAALSATNVNSARVLSSVTIAAGGARAVTVTGGGGTLDLLAAITLPTWTGGADAAIAVSGRSSGTVTFGPVVTKAGQLSGGVSLSAPNTASTVVFGDALTLRTGPRPAVSASNGTLRWQPASTLVTTTGTALTLQNVTTAGSAEFAEVSSAGALNGIVVDGLSGAGLRIVGGTIANSTGDGVKVTALKASLLLQAMTIKDGALDGVHLEQDSGTGTVSIKGSQFSGNLDDHIQVTARSAGALNAVEIANNTLTGNTPTAWGQGIVVESDAGFNGTLRYLIANNTVTGAGFTAIRVAALSGGGRLNGTITGNQVGTVAVPCGALVDGIAVLSDQASVAGVTRIANNTIVGCQTGIRLRAAEGAAALHATVVGNTVSNRPVEANYAMRAEFGVPAGSSGTSCLDASQNSLAGGPAVAGTALRVRLGYGSLQLPGYAGGSADSNAVRVYLASRNSPTPTVDVATPTGGSFTNTALCQTPDPIG